MSIRPKGSFFPFAATLAGAILLVGASSDVLSNPRSPVVIRGAADFISGGGELRIVQHTDRSVIDWQSFSIATNEVTRFVQPRQNSAVLNRVIGTSPSRIDGHLLANGHVFLINANGVVIGPAGRIDVGGFVASTLDVDIDEFMDGRALRFRGDSPEAIVNLGEISASGGDVFLIGASVTNSGRIDAPGGRVGIAAGTDVLLMDSGDERIKVRIGRGSIVNEGTIRARVAELKAHGGNIAALAIRNDGKIQARSISREGSKIYLRSRDGGRIVNTGELTARSDEASGPEVIIDAGAEGAFEGGGTIDAGTPGGTGGELLVLADRIDITSDALFLADGDLGGGRIRMGGGLRGEDPSLANARLVTVAEGAQLGASAGSSGDGGTIIVYSDQTLDFQGSAAVRGGTNGGDGGFVELSGKKEIRIDSLVEAVDLSAPAGASGTLLIDPNDINVVDGAGSPIGGSPANANTLNDADIEDFLQNTGSLVIETSGNGGSGDITVDGAASITWSTGNNLSFNADRKFLHNGAINATGSGGLNVDATRHVTLGGGSSVQTNAGDIDLMAGGNIVVDGSVSATGGDITFQASGGAEASLFAFDNNTDQLLSIDPNTGAGTVIGAVGFTEVMGLAFDSNTSTLYGVDAGSNQLITIDTATGAGTAVGALGVNFSDVVGAAYDPNSDTLYATDVIGPTSRGLYTVDTSTGTGTEVGAIGFGGVDALAASPGGGSITVNGSLSAGSGHLRFLASRDVTFDGPIDGSGNLTIAPTDNATSIGIGDGASGTLNLDGGDIGQLQNGFSSITIGDTANGSGEIDIRDAHFLDPIVLASPNGAGSMNGSLTTNGESITVKTDLDLAGNSSLDSTRRTAERARRGRVFASRETSRAADRT